jgi:hypothetical protein
MKDLVRAKGAVTVRVLDRDGKVKRWPAGFVRRLLGLPGKPMVIKHHNVITRTGDALMADALLKSPTKTKVVGGSGYMQAGTGWNYSGQKNATKCFAPTGSYAALESGCPFLKAAWGNNGDTTLVYRATFQAGALSANGINEAALLNGNTSSAVCLAYAQVSPAVNVTSADTLQIVWEITIFGQ